MEQLRQKHIAFINAYTSLGQKSYQNASESARIAGYSAESAGNAGNKLLKRSKIIQEIDRITAEQNAVAVARQDISKEKYLGMMTEAYEICGPKHSNAPRYAEIIARVKGFFSDVMQNNLMIVNVKSEEFKNSVSQSYDSLARRIARDRASLPAAQKPQPQKPE